MKTNFYKYVKKPIIIEAFKYEGDLSANRENCIPNYKEADDSSWGLFAKTLEGDMLCEVGCYIIQGVEGEIYPCRSDIFDKTYEKVINNNFYKTYTDEGFLVRRLSKES